ncbi:M23 family peptidase [Streptomyces solincola]|uniref:M23 family peptidase n=1 Tax=Streptomyces solincola TaxID=2100817 RepID=A0A2S9PW15_9ACTN|nr:M23 family metallopeptidase [Streptomyces solincola]PRH78599.1 M23 family peptidase [Streptomyces solincola]
MRQPSPSVLGVSLATAAVVLLWGAAPTAPAADAPSKLTVTPLLMAVPTPPRWFEGTDGKVHLVYELRLTNALAGPVTVKTVTSKDEKTRKDIARLSGSSLTNAMTPMTQPDKAGTTIPASSTSVVWMDVTLPGGAPPSKITHAVNLDVPEELPLPTPFSEDGAVAAVDTRQPVKLSPPLRGPGWIAVGSCCDGPHRRAAQPVDNSLKLGERFAIDFNGSDPGRRLVKGDPSVNKNWVFYNAPVLAVADGVVVASRNDVPDQTPGKPPAPSFEDADGNYVIVDIGDGRYAGYAHLVPGSVQAEAGDRVRKGQVLGRLGNSGNSTGPHLHFQVMNAPDMLDSDGLPFELERFTLEGTTPPVTEELLSDLENGMPVSIDSAGSGERRDQYPLGRDVLRFGQPRRG